MTKYLIPLIFLIIASFLFDTAKGSTCFSSGIAMDRTCLPAIDLTYNGKDLSFEEAHDFVYKKQAKQLQNENSDLSYNEAYDLVREREELQFVTEQLLEKDIFKEAQETVDQSGKITLKEAVANIREQNVKTIKKKDILEDFEPNFTLANLSPKESDIWNKTPIYTWKEYQKIDQEGVKIIQEDVVGYSSILPSPHNYFRFQVNLGSESYDVYLGRFSHSILLRKAILRKLGYVVPAVKHYKTLEVQFKSTLFIKQFREEVKRKTGASDSRWIQEETDRETLILQDVVILPSNFVLPQKDIVIASFVLGTVPPSVHKQRRIYRSLLVPFALTYFNESLNIFSPVVGKIKNNQFNLFYPWEDDFHTSVHDAKWIAGLMSKLTREDFKDISKSAMLPPACELLLREKLISRFDNLMQLLDVEIDQIGANLSVSDPDEKDLKDGKLLKEDWQGYGSRFAWGDTESPLKDEDWFAFIIHKSLTLLNNLVLGLVNNELPGIDLNDQKLKEIDDYNRRTLLEYVNSGGKTKAKALEFYKIPQTDFDIILSTETVVGSYLGAENTVQVADTFGFSFKIGTYIGSFGLPSTMSFGIDTNIRWVKQYTRLKPFLHLNDILKEKFYRSFDDFINGKWDETLRGANNELSLEKFIKKLIALNNLLDNQEHIKNRAKEIVKEREANPDLPRNLSARQQAIKEIRDKITALQSSRKENFEEYVNGFKKLLAVGESIVISESIMPNASVLLGMKSKTNEARALVRFNAAQKKMHRVHITRMNENTIQIYEDKGRKKDFGWGIAINFLLKLFNYDYTSSDGKIKTKYFTLNIDTDERKNPILKETILALNKLLTNSSFELIEELGKGIQIYHDRFEDEYFSGVLLAKVWRGLDSRSKVRILYPNGIFREFFTRVGVEQRGTDYERLVIDVANTAVNEYVSQTFGYDSVLKLNLISSSNPGSTLFGVGRLREIAYSSELVKFNHIKQKDLSKVGLSKPHMRVTYKTQGWSLNKQEAYNLIKKTNAIFHDIFAPDLIDANELSTLKRILFFNLKLDIKLFPESIVNMARLSAKKVKKIFYQSHPSDYYRCNFEKENPKNKHRCNAHKKFVKYQKMYRKYMHEISSKRKDLDKAAFAAMKMVNIAERNLSKKDLTELVGGMKFIFVKAVLIGFREGAEDAKLGNTISLRPVFSHTIGTYGDNDLEDLLTPYEKLMQNIGITNSQLNAHWIRTSM